MKIEQRLRAIIRSRVTAGLLGGVIVLAAGTIVASAGGGGQVINACVNRATGLVRIIDPAQNQTCNALETATSWNQVGPQGPAGPPGPQGAVGPQGPQGAAGVSGYQVVLDVVTVQPGAPSFFEVQCPTGKQAISGGVKDGSNDTQTLQSFQTGTPTGTEGNEWEVLVRDTIPSNSPATNTQLYAICITPS